MNTSQVRDKVLALRQKGLTLINIAAALNEEGIKTQRGTKVNPSFVSYLLSKTGKKHAKKTISKDSKEQRRTISLSWVRKVLTDHTLQDGEKVRIIDAYLK